MTTTAKQKAAIPEQQFMTFGEAMRYLHVSRSTLYRFMWSGRLTGYKVGSRYRFYRADLDACVKVVL